MRDCDSSDEGVNVNANSTPMVSSGMEFPRSPEHQSESHLKYVFVQIQFFLLCLVPSFAGEKFNVVFVRFFFLVSVSLC